VSGDIRITEILYRLENACGQTKILFWVIRKSVVVPEILESILFKQTEILWPFQKFWTNWFASNRDSVPVPKIPELLCWVKQRFCDRSRNSGIEDRSFGSTRDSVVVPETLESVIWEPTEILWSFGNSGPVVLGSNIDSVVVPEILG
jgi:hypothetical protein